MVPALTSAALAALLLAVPVAARADSAKPSFAFARAGVTTPEKAAADAGEPDLDYETFLLPGEIDPFVAAPTPGSIEANGAAAEAKGVELVPVRVQEWWIDGAEDDIATRLVYREGVLLYAVLPAAASESSREKLAAKFGALPEPTVEHRFLADRRITYGVFDQPRRGVRFIERAGVVVARVVYAPAP